MMQAAIGIHTTDPIHRPIESPGALTRWARGLIMDERDLPFLPLIAAASVVMIPFAVTLFIPGLFRWWLAPIYLAVSGFVFLDRYVLMLHNTSHRLLFRPEVWWMNYYVPWVLGPFFGESPEAYAGHHLGMHHPENNLEEDLSTTMFYQRDRVLHFAHYFLSFFFTTLYRLPVYLWRKGRGRMGRKTLFGEMLFLVWMAGLSYFNWRATLVVYVIPFVAVRFLMMAGNWGQHAFIDPARPENCYANAITCINTRYNRRCFNDGYHIGHHLKANRHWTEMPGEFEANVATYAKERAIVFEGIDFFIVWLFLMLGRFDWLAKHYVSLDRKKRDEGEIIALLKSRLVPIHR